jgi:hypothetical protein
MNKKGWVGWVMFFLAIFVWLVVILTWYLPRAQVNPQDASTFATAITWAVVCGLVATIGLIMEQTIH